MGVSRDARIALTLHFLMRRGAFLLDREQCNINGVHDR